MKEEFNEEPFQQNNTQNKNGSTTMNVILRVRPLTQKQKGINSHQTIKVINNKNLVLLDQHEEDGQKKNRSRETKCSFDFIYDAIYDQSISNLLEAVLNGYNSTIIAYGATGCGKTYTMIGQQGKEGIFALSMIDLLGRANHQRNFKNINIKLSYIEIYNEIIKDLLISQDKNLQIRQDLKDGVQIIGATQILITSMIELNIVLKVGAANRSKDSTTSNQVSSRSHAILMIKIQSKDKENSLKQQKQTLIGKFLLVDLAGSQKTAWLKGSKQIQGSKINRSLLTLGNCIQILAQSNGKNQFIPYRQSKLTRLLKQSLGGNCRTTMIINISPFISNWQETFNSLLYGNRAKNIKNMTYKISQPQANGNGSNYISLINSLKRQNDQLKNQLKNHVKNKNNSLPQLKADPSIDLQEKEAEKTKKKIKIHFQEELKLIRIINEFTIKVDKLAFQLYGSEVDSKPSKNKSLQKGQKDKKENKLRVKIGDLGRQKMNFQQKLQQLVFNRATILTEIKSNHFSNRLMIQYRQKKIQLQLQQIKLRQRRIENENSEKQHFMKELKEEVHLRDKIIEEQKVLIQKNNIVNRITYSKINFGYKEEDIQHLMDKINVKKTSLPQSFNKEKQVQFNSSSLKNKLSENEYKHSIVVKPIQKIKKQPRSITKRQKSEGNLIIKNNVQDDKAQGKLKRQRPYYKNKNKSKMDQINYVFLQR